MLHAHQSEQTPGESEGQGGLASCSPWGRRESDTTQRLTHTQVTQVVKNPPTNVGDAGDMDLIPGVERPSWSRKWQPTPVFLPGKFHGQGTWWATVHGVIKSQTWLSV